MNRKSWVNIAAALAWFAMLICILSYCVHVARVMGGELPILGKFEAPTNVQITVFKVVFCCGMFVGAVATLSVFAVGCWWQRLIAVVPGIWSCYVAVVAIELLSR